MMKFNDIGSPGLHKHHTIEITEKENVGRALVLDQHIIDVLFTQKKLDARQHRACNKYLNIIGKSGCFVGSPDLQQILFTSKYHQHEPKSLILLESQRVIKKICGIKKESIFWKIMTENPTKINQKQIDIIICCSDALLTTYYVNTNTPISFFQQGLQDRP
tara:strand:+ start:170 stop:652 length:483 start_codon:yes stop_codon:yes gene_type:complete